MTSSDRHLRAGKKDHHPSDVSSHPQRQADRSYRRAEGARSSSTLSSRSINLRTGSTDLPPSENDLRQMLNANPTWQLPGPIVTLRVNKGGQPLVVGVSHSTAESLRCVGGGAKAVAFRDREVDEVGSVVDRLNPAISREGVYLGLNVSARASSARIRHALDAAITRGRPTLSRRNNNAGRSRTAGLSRRVNSIDLRRYAEILDVQGIVEANNQWVRMLHFNEHRFSHDKPDRLCSMRDRCRAGTG